jgi:hypothetical protein
VTTYSAQDLFSLALLWRKRELETVGSGDRVLDHCSLLKRRAVRYVEAKRKLVQKKESV